MKRIVSIVVLFSFSLNCTFAPKRDVQYTTKGPIVVSERVGDVIDSEEREDYGLFLPEIYLRPLTYRYESAMICSIPGGGYEVRIATAEGTLISVNKDPRGMEVLTDYIDNYEEVKESRATFEDKWNIVDYDFLSLPITKHEIELTREYLRAEKRFTKRKSVLAGAGLGGSVVGLTAFVIAITSAETSHDISDPGIEGTWGCIEGMSNLAVAGCIGVGGGLAGAVVRGLVGYAVGNAKESEWRDAEDLIIVDIIKEQRMPRVAGK